MKSQSGNKDHQSPAAKKNYLFNLESSKLIISSKGDLGLHCTQINVQLQLRKQISYGTVQGVVAIANVESSGVALEEQRCNTVGYVSPSLHGDAEGERKEEMIEVVILHESAQYCVFWSRHSGTHSMTSFVKWRSHLVQASSRRLNAFSVFQVWNSILSTTGNHWYQEFSKI